MALPSLKVEVAFNAGYTTAAASRTWTDVSTYVEGAQPVSDGRGRSDEVSAIQPARLSLTLNNRDGRFTPRLASGAYYPNVKKGRPVRVTMAYPPADSYNLMTAENASFEGGTIGTWTTAGTPVPVLTNSAVRAWSGTKSLLVTWQGSGSFPQALVSVTGLTIGLAYTWAAYIYVPAGSPDVITVFGGVSGTQYSTKDAWVRTSQTFTATGTSHNVGFRGVGPPLGTQLFVDAGMVNLGSTPGEFNTVAQATYSRYLGYVSEWPVSWPDGTSADCIVSLTSASRAMRMGRGADLRSIIEQETGIDLPMAEYPLGEPAGSTSAADTSGNQAPALTMAGTGTDVVFGNATGPGTDGLTAATFADGKYLATTLPSAPAALEAWFATSTNDAVERHVVGIGAGGGAAVLNGNLTDGAGGSYGIAVADGLEHHVVLNGTTARILLDGVDIGPLFSLDPNLKVGKRFIGSVAHVAAYSATLSGTRVTAHYQAGSTGFAGEFSGARIARYAAYAGIPTAEQALDTGIATIGHFDITGMTPIAAMQKVAETEGGVLYDARDGTLTFKQRDARYTVASAFSLSVTAQEVEADLEPKDDDQFVVNDVTATANGAPAGRALDATSLADQGVYAKTLDTVTDNVSDALAGAQWAVTLGADPPPRYSTVTVDITNSSPAQAALVLAADIGTRFTLTNLPSQAPAASVDLFVEGYSEVITATSHRITFNTSPAAGYDVWTIEDAVFGQYDAYPISY